MDTPVEADAAPELGAGAPAEDDATLPPTLTPLSTPIMVSASPPVMVPCHASIVTAQITNTVVMMCPMLLKRLFMDCLSG